MRRIALLLVVVLPLAVPLADSVAASQDSLFGWSHVDHANQVPDLKSAPAPGGILDPEPRPTLPESASLLLFGTGLFGLTTLLRHKR